MCQGEQPDLNQLAEDYEGRVVFAGVSNNDTVEDGRGYVEEFGVPYAMGHAPEVWAAYDDPVRPSTIVIDAAGDIATVVTGPVSLEGMRQILDQVT
ncbi:MAG: TlpA family protein disulfide reductase [Actinomycetota bacterium]